MPHTIVVGAGPGGATLAYLLASRGCDVTLLERNRDFEREFRGEVLMPSGCIALEQMGLGLASTLHGVPQASIPAGAFYFNRRKRIELTVDRDFMRGHPPRVVSQPGMLEAIVAEASKHPTFHFERGAVVRDVLRDGERVTGVRVHTESGDRNLPADLVIGADGRASVVRRRGGFQAEEDPLPVDIVWCKVPAPDWFTAETPARVYVSAGHLVLLARSFDDKLQIAWVIWKGTFGELRRQGIEAWVEQMADHVSDDLAGHLRASTGAITSPFLLDTVSDLVTPWSQPGVFVMGDAAHTMSPVGGQGINIALRDSIVAANHLVPALRERSEAVREGGPEAIDRATDRIEQERRPEVTRIQRLQALPPRVIFATTWWGGLVRAALPIIASLPLPGVGPANQFLFGVDDVSLQV